jgi:hypothetical protein
VSDAGEQVLVPDRLLDEIHSSGLHRLDGHRHGAIAGDDPDDDITNDTEARTLRIDSQDRRGDNQGPSFAASRGCRDSEREVLGRQADERLT